MWKSGHWKVMVVSEFGGLWRGDITRFCCSFVCLFDMINNLSVMLGCVFLG